MRRLFSRRWWNRYDEIVTIFANTAQEREETLAFIHECDVRLQFHTVWVEAVVHHGLKKSCTHKVVDYQTASRNGEPFEQVIKKYGLPGPGRLHCTRELKTNAMLSYVHDELGWAPGTFDTAIGIRADEAKRRDDKHVAKKIVYPLLDWTPLSKADVNAFWVRQPFRLNLTGYQGNCKWCWKKSLRKHMTLLSENPQHYDFPERMDALYGQIGYEFDEGKAKYEKRTMFRGNMSTADLRKTYELNKHSLEAAKDDSVVLPTGQLIKIDTEDADCVESCEPHFGEAL